jgi:uncharacterized membrane protein (DUF485 family)
LKSKQNGGQTAGQGGRRREGGPNFDLALYRPAASHLQGINSSTAATVIDKFREDIVDQATARRIENDPNYQKLVSERKSLGWTLAAITLVMYYGYIAIVAFAPSLIAAPLFGSITVGIVLGIAIILASILLTGIYVMRANAEYDDLTNVIVAANLRGGK